MSGGGRIRGELGAQFGAARKLRPEFELRQLKASVRSRLFGTVEPSPTIGGYTVRHLIGRGGSGTVYAAVDPDGEPVALKVLQGYTPAALYRLKTEFRALAGVVHPNLVPLHNLVIRGRQAFLTMELIDGVDFLTHVRGTPPEGANIPRLRSALAQLVAGIAALHAAGKLHRDIKPSNVLVTPEGRVAILDFGLVHDLGDDQSVSRSYETVVGTPAYMAPELATGLQPRAASDWYSVGVMLYEALIGELPFRGSGLEVLCAKCREDPARARELDPSIPEDLDALCWRLLDRSPERRPDHVELLARVGARSWTQPGEDERVSRAAGGPTRRPRTRLFGRARQLQALERALHEVRPRHPVLVRVHGPSGTGKTALVQAFLDRVHTLGRGKVVAGRCYASESVPFKAFDSLVDGLMELLLGQRAERGALDGLLPKDAAALARVFPVLARVPEIAAQVEAAPEASDGPRGLRAAYAALRELLTRIVARWPLVLFIDDLQWGDSDSAALLAELLRGPDAPGVLFITGYRAEEALEAHERVAPSGDGPEVREIEVGPLTLEDAEAMARAELEVLSGGLELAAVDGDRYDVRLGDARVIARESRGSPLLVQELCQHVHGRVAHGDVALEARAVSLGQVVGERIKWLPGHARRVMEVIAVAGRPLDETTALRVADCGARGRAGLELLRSEHLVRRRATRSGSAVEVF
ncbi:MAG: protein kinase, partial [Myxococcales bacterium]|nr:protein kinase [Myxococcales bacterium]